MRNMPMRPTTEAILLRAAEIIAAGWTRGAGARTRKGYETTVLDPDAAKFCARGAVIKATHEIIPRDDRRFIARDEAFAAVERQIVIDTGSRKSITLFNDDCSSKHPVLRVLRDATKLIPAPR